MVGLDNAELLADKVVQKELSVRQIENLVKVFKFNKNNAKNVKNANVLDLESQLSDKLGMRVNLTNKKNNSGKLSFEYRGIDQLNRLVDIIKKNY